MSSMSPAIVVAPIVISEPEAVSLSSELAPAEVTTAPPETVVLPPVMLAAVKLPPVTVRSPVATF